MPQIKTPFELTEEITTFSELRQHLLTRLRKAEGQRIHNHENYVGSREEKLANQAFIVGNHLLSLFEQREKLS
ncbi:hypothetical protein LCGC14_0739620 [marine sediment metagenome]|uniref:Uncharacterized protein n=1 Tax=marine sediment metagenome TaxID=412755 RepID=A0A0F9Q780_9ZZZZ